MKKPATKKKEMTQRDKLFVFEYLIDMKAKRAALAVGYSKTVAETKAYQWVSDSKVKPLVYNAIQKALKKRSGRLEITADRVLNELAKMGFANMEDYITRNEEGDAHIDLSALTRDQAAAIQEITVDSYKDPENNKRVVKKVKLKLSGKRENLDLLGRHLRLFDDKSEQPVVININYGHRQEDIDEG